MRIVYHAPFSINDYLKNVVTEKLGKLENLQLNLLEIDAFFKLKEGANAPNDKEFELKIHVPNLTLFAKGHADTFERAIPLTAEKMRKQLIKYKKSLEPKRG